MHELLIWIIGFTLLGGVLSVVTASFFLLLPVNFRNRMLPSLVSFATGALLGAAFLALLPHAIENTYGVGAHKIAITILTGVIIFFLMEKMVLWRHCHAHECEAHDLAQEQGRKKAVGQLILVGDTIHNLVDGILIAAAFMTDIHLGVVTSLAVIAHEIPQELGDFALLLHSGFSRGKAMLFNMISGLSTVLGGIVAYYSLSVSQQLVPYVLALAASSFIYIAVADLIPGLHKRVEAKATLQQMILILSGIAIIYTSHTFLH
jgi:zinc and cadmium transporter